MYKWYLLITKYLRKHLRFKKIILCCAKVNIVNRFYDQSQTVNLNGGILTFVFSYFFHFLLYIANLCYPFLRWSICFFLLPLTPVLPIFLSLCLILSQIQTHSEFRHLLERLESCLFHQNVHSFCVWHASQILKISWKVKPIGFH